MCGCFCLCARHEKQSIMGYRVTSQHCCFAFNAMLISHSTWSSVLSKQYFCFIVAPPLRRFQPTTAVPKENKLTAHASNVLLLWYVVHHSLPVSVLPYLFWVFVVESRGRRCFAQRRNICVRSEVRLCRNVLQSAANLKTLTETNSMWKISKISCFTCPTTLLAGEPHYSASDGRLSAVLHLSHHKPSGLILYFLIKSDQNQFPKTSINLFLAANLPAPSQRCTAPDRIPGFISPLWLACLSSSHVIDWKHLIGRQQGGVFLPRWRPFWPPGASELRSL